MVLASGDPMFYGIGSTLARVLGAARLIVLPHPSSVSVAAARLGWPLDDVAVVTAARPRIAVAGGAAFTFGYAEHPELLAAAARDYQEKRVPG